MAVRRERKDLMKYLIAAIVVVISAWASVAAEASGSIVVERAWARASKGRAQWSRLSDDRQQRDGQ